MNQNYYTLPADYCKDAIEKYLIAKEDAIQAKDEVMKKYGCVAFLRSGRHIQGLAYDKYTDLSGFTVPRKFDGYFIIKPKMNTIRGKEAQKILDNCGDLLEIWQWALEHSLGVYGVVRDYHGFHYLNARPLRDGRVVLIAPAGKNLQGPNISRNFNDPVIPDCATPISEAEGKLLLIYECIEREEA